MKKPITLVSAALVAAVCSLSVHADKVYYVEPDGNNPEGMTVDAVYTKIGTAINNVTADEPVTIYLKPGHVFSENNMNTNTNRIDLTIIGDTDETGTRVTFNRGSPVGVERHHFHRGEELFEHGRCALLCRKFRCHFRVGNR